MSITDTTGLHLDNFQIVSTTAPAADSKGTATGTYFNGVTLGAAGAVPGDSNTAASFDGVDDYVSVARQVQDDLSPELRFRSTQGIGVGTSWSQGAGLVDGNVAAVANDFGVSLRSDGKVVGGIGNPDTSIVSTTSGFNDGAWHHVVFTRVKASGALKLYVDGSLEGSATAVNAASLTAQATINLGRLANGASYFAGSLDEVATYNVALSAAAVLAHAGG